MIPGADAFSPLPRLVHQYRNRVLLFVTDRCFIHCRYSFRSAFTGSGAGIISESELDAAVGYLEDHTEVREIILSGGDPLTLSDEALSGLANRLRDTNPDIIIRIGTRAPSALPSRITDKLVSILSKVKPVWVVAQWNHPKEF